MRIRSTKPEFWRSERIASLDWDVRLVLKGLESYVDDNGVGKFDLILIVSDIFPRDLARDASRTIARVQTAISDIEKAGLMWRYATDEVEYLYLSFWEKAQRPDRPTPGRFPRPDGTMDYGASVIGVPPRDHSRGLDVGTGEQGNRGTGEQGKKTPSPQAASAFEEFWSAYPRKVGKDGARRKFAIAVKRADPSTIVAGAQRYATDPNLPDAQFIPHPTTWLNEGRWTDGPCPPPARRNTGRDMDSEIRATVALGERLQTAVNIYPLEISR